MTHSPFVIQGRSLYTKEQWWPNNGGEPTETNTIITTSANKLVGEIHDHMPVILPGERYDEWLDGGNQNVES